MDPLTGATLAQGAANIGSGIVNNLFQKRNLRLQTEANKELAGYAYDKDLEMWHLQNQYNSPKAQMQRFAEAGLNPNLIYGKGTPGNATAMPKAQQVTSGKLNTQMPKMDMLGLYQNVRQNEANIKSTQSQTNFTDLRSTSEMLNQAIQTINAQQKQWNLGTSRIYDRQDRRMAQTLSTEKILGSKASTRLTNENYLNTRYHKKPLLQQQYQLQAKKFALIDAQINMSLMDYATKLRNYKWLNVEKGVGLAGKAVGSAIGVAGVGKIGKLVQPGRPKFSKYTRNEYRRNQDINPNYNF